MWWNHSGFPGVSQKTQTSENWKSMFYSFLANLKREKLEWNRRIFITLNLSRRAGVPQNLLQSRNALNGRRFSFSFLNSSTCFLCFLSMIKNDKKKPLFVRRNGIWWFSMQITLIWIFVAVFPFIRFIEFALL